MDCEVALGLGCKYCHHRLAGTIFLNLTYEAVFYGFEKQLLEMDKKIAELEKARKEGRIS